MAETNTAPKKDRAEKYLEDYPDVFADIVNNLLLKKKMIQEEQLIPGPTESLYKAADGNDLKEQRRDVCKFVRDADIIISMIGIENQSVPDKDMPFRIMGYDYGSYRGQITAGDERFPVLSSVLYFGQTPWTKPLSIRGIVNLPDGYEEVFTDYRINLIDVPRLPAELRARLTSDFRAVADFFAGKSNPDYKPSRQKLKHVEAVLQLLKVFTKDKRYEQIEGEIMESVENGEEVSMCEFAERMERQGIEKGLSEGLQKGLSEGIARGAIGAFRETGLLDNEIIAKVSSMFHLPADEVRKYL